MIYESAPAAPPVVDIDIVRDTRSTEYREQVDKAAKEFEGILLAQLFRVMRSTIPETELLGSGFEREVYEDMMFTEIASVSARSDSLGIAEMLYRQFVDQSRADGNNAGGAIADDKSLDP
jgi:Rod binding domain-containing protein